MLTQLQTKSTYDKEQVQLHIYMQTTICTLTNDLHSPFTNSKS